MKLDNSATALHCIPRYLKLNPDFKEQYADYLYEKGLYEECVKVLQDILDDDGYSSKAGKDKKEFYFDLVSLITEHPSDIKCV